MANTEGSVLPTLAETVGYKAASLEWTCARWKAHHLEIWPKYCKTRSLAAQLTEEPSGHRRC